MTIPEAVYTVLTRAAAMADYLLSDPAEIAELENSGHFYMAGPYKGKLRHSWYCDDCKWCGMSKLEGDDESTVVIVRVIQDDPAIP